jgi:hypothetical protein
MSSCGNLGQLYVFQQVVHWRLTDHSFPEIFGESWSTLFPRCNSISKSEQKQESNKYYVVYIKYQGRVSYSWPLVWWDGFKYLLCFVRSNDQMLWAPVWKEKYCQYCNVYCFLGIALSHLLETEIRGDLSTWHKTHRVLLYCYCNYQ